MYRPKYFKDEFDFDTVNWQIIFEMKQREFGKEINITWYKAS